MTEISPARIADIHRRLGDHQARVPGLEQELAEARSQFWEKIDYAQRTSGPIDFWRETEEAAGRAKRASAMLAQNRTWISRYESWLAKHQPSPEWEVTYQVPKVRTHHVIAADSDAAREEGRKQLTEIGVRDFIIDSVKEINS